MVYSFSSSDVRLQFRLPDGSSITQNFPSDEVLETARLFICSVSLFSSIYFKWPYILHALCEISSWLYQQIWIIYLENEFLQKNIFLDDVSSETLCRRRFLEKSRWPWPFPKRCSSCRLSKSFNSSLRVFIHLTCTCIFTKEHNHRSNCQVLFLFAQPLIPFFSRRQTPRRILMIPKAYRFHPF